GAAVRRADVPAVAAGIHLQVAAAELADFDVPDLEVAGRVHERPCVAGVGALGDSAVSAHQHGETPRRARCDPDLAPVVLRERADIRPGRLRPGVAAVGASPDATASVVDAAVVSAGRYDEVDVTRSELHVFHRGQRHLVHVGPGRTVVVAPPQAAELGGGKHDLGVDRV